jgi:hypothetical protein
MTRLQKGGFFYFKPVYFKTIFMYYNSNTFIYLNGEIVKASEAKIDLYSQTLHYGYGVFEGIRS